MTQFGARLVRKFSLAIGHGVNNARTAKNQSLIPNPQFLQCPAEPPQRALDHRPAFALAFHAQHALVAVVVEQGQAGLMFSAFTPSPKAQWLMAMPACWPRVAAASDSERPSCERGRAGR